LENSPGVDSDCKSVFGITHKYKGCFKTFMCMQKLLLTAMLCSTYFYFRQSCEHWCI